MKNKQNSFSFYNGDNNVVISDAVGKPDKICDSASPDYSDIMRIFDKEDNPDALRNYEAALHSLADNPSTKHLYGYLMSDKEWFDRFTGFFAGKKTLPLLYDPFFKMIFNPVESRARLSELVSCILGQHVTVIEVFPDTSYAFVNSFVIMDMVVRLDDGSITNIEIQKVPYDFPAARISCYSADLVLRQFRMLQGMNEGQRNDYYDDAAAGKTGNETSQAAGGSSSKPSYENMKKVHTIIFFEKSSSSLKSPKDKRLYFHVGKTVFNTEINMKLLQEYHLISLDTFRKYRYSDIIEGRIDSADIDCDDTQYENRLTEKMRRDRLMYLSLFTAETPDEINRLAALFPELFPIRQKIREYLTRPKEVINMFSEALRILDNNTAELMADRFKAQLENAKIEVKAVKHELKTTRKEVTAARQELKITKQEVNAAKQEANAAKQEVDAAKQKVDAAKQEVDAAKQEATAANERAENESKARIAADAKVAELQAQIKELKEKYELTN